MDYCEAWLALSQRPLAIDLPRAESLVGKYPAVADRVWAQRWEDLREILADVVSPLHLSTEAGMNHVSGATLTPQPNPEAVHVEDTTVSKCDSSYCMSSLCCV